MTGGSELPAAIQKFVDATNAGDAATFAAAFSTDAYVEDWGRTFHGRDGVAQWNETDNSCRAGQPFRDTSTWTDEAT
jgi:hypothetical protein